MQKVIKIIRLNFNSLDIIIFKNCIIPYDI